MTVTECRACGNRTLLPILDLGEQALTGVFPGDRAEQVPSVPLQLIRCSPDGCGLVQLRHTADLELMYGKGYGYRSGLGDFMVRHLGNKVSLLTGMVDLGPDDLVLDIGSNDATLLRAYPGDGPTLVGIDPTGDNFREYYPEHVTLISEFFSREVFTERFGRRRAKLVTSIAMFYDLPRPLEFMRDVHDILDEDGLWLMEQSYVLSMLEANAYDVVCHEHLEYYALRQIEWMAGQVGLKVVSAEVNDVYGGSLCVVLARQGSAHRVDEEGVARVRAREATYGLDTMIPFEAFARRAVEHRDALGEFLRTSQDKGLTTLGYGASTKGNVILQYCGITERELPCIGEVNKDKHGHFTPGTGIPVVSEAEAKSRRPDQLLVLPWIYRDGFVERESAYLRSGGRLVFPLPDLNVV